MFIVLMNLVATILLIVIIREVVITMKEEWKYFSEKEIDKFEDWED